MAENYTERYDELIHESMGVHGAMRINLLEQAAKLADANNDVPLGYVARKDIVDAAEWSGNTIRAFTVFPWLLAQYDKDPTLDDDESILWDYKWIATGLIYAPEITWESIKGIWKDFERRYRDRGYSLKPLYKIQAYTYIRSGRRDEARKKLSQWHDAERDFMSDCHACDLSEAAEIHYILGEFEKGIETASEVLKGRRTCLHEPHRTRANALVPLLETGNYRRAITAHKKGYRQIYEDTAFLPHSGAHLLFLTLTGNLHWAAHVFARHYPWIHQVKAPLATYEFLRYASYFLQRCSVASLEVEDLRRICHAVNRSRRGQAAERVESLNGVMRAIEAPLTDLAKRFDKRNGNSWYSDRLDVSTAYDHLLRERAIDGEHLHV